MKYVDDVQKAIDFIERNLLEPVELSRIAEEALLSQAQLYRVFYALTGHPVKDYVRKRKMSKAADQLKHTDRTVTDIAEECGFESYHSFAKAFKKLVGLTPSDYRISPAYFSFEPIQLRSKLSYMGDSDISAQFPDVKVTRLYPCAMYTYLHEADAEAGMEESAWRIAMERIGSVLHDEPLAGKLRIFGNNVDLTASSKFGYRISVLPENENDERGRLLDQSGLFERERFAGGLYAMVKTAALRPELVQRSWDRLLAEWIPHSAFELGEPPYFEQFHSCGGTITKMSLYLPLERQLRPDCIEMVTLPEAPALYARGAGCMAQIDAERQMIAWCERIAADRRGWQGVYYISYAYGQDAAQESSYWWENGIIGADMGWNGCGLLDTKRLHAGLYACCVTKAYGTLTGILDKMHRWIEVHRAIRPDTGRQWFAAYHTVEGTDIERDSVVKVYIPIKEAMIV